MGVKETIAQWDSEQVANEREEEVTKMHLSMQEKELYDEEMARFRSSVDEGIKSLALDLLIAEVTSEVTTELNKRNVLSMREHGLRDEEISKLLNISLRKIKALFEEN